MLLPPILPIVRQTDASLASAGRRLRLLLRPTKILNGFRLIDPKHRVIAHCSIDQFQGPTSVKRAGSHAIFAMKHRVGSLYLWIFQKNCRFVRTHHRGHVGPLRLIHPPPPPLYNLYLYLAVGPTPMLPSFANPDTASSLLVNNSAPDVLRAVRSEPRSDPFQPSSFLERRTNRRGLLAQLNLEVEQQNAQTVRSVLPSPGTLLLRFNLGSATPRVIAEIHCVPTPPRQTFSGLSGGQN
ncbi:hypothetical protein K438DRAFT_1756695 [Mycena galopus ATCC 62051]|nr:hypothetical protein K438DRAFT_1756695 [Mycena galopus ATCC 62051]